MPVSRGEAGRACRARRVRGGCRGRSRAVLGAGARRRPLRSRWHAGSAPSGEVTGRGARGRELAAPQTSCQLAVRKLAGCQLRPASDVRQSWFPLPSPGWPTTIQPAVRLT